MGKLQINMLGASFAVQAKEDDEYLKKLLDYYTVISDTIRKSGNIHDSLQISILTGITLVDELYKAKKTSASFERELSGTDNAEAERITMEMIEKINRVLESTNEASVQAEKITEE